jgi:hypothetical protein
MRRMVWVSLGAVGGILAYRKLEELANESMSKGLVLTVMDAGTSARAFATGVGEQVSKIRQSAQSTQPTSIIP